MNKLQHFFIWVGIALIAFMAIALDNPLFWLVAAVVLIGEIILLCNNKLSYHDFDIPDLVKLIFKLLLLCLAIVGFVILFITEDLQKDIRREIRHYNNRY